MLSKRLNLTPDQTAKLEPILADRDQKISALFANSQLAPQDRREQFKAIHQATEQQLATVLTPRPAPAAKVDAPRWSLPSRPSRSGPGSLTKFQPAAMAFVPAEAIAI